MSQASDTLCSKSLKAEAFSDPLLFDNIFKLLAEFSVKPFDDTIPPGKGICLKSTILDGFVGLPGMAEELFRQNPPFLSESPLPFLEDDIETEVEVIVLTENQLKFGRKIFLSNWQGTC